MGALAEMASAGAKALMEAVDADGDGKLTLGEMTERYEHFGLPAGARGSGALRSQNSNVSLPNHLAFNA